MSSKPDEELLDEAPPVESAEVESTLDSGVLHISYVPDFRVDDLILYFIPGRDGAREVYHSLPPSVLDRWSAYLTKKGYRFLSTDEVDKADGPYRVKPGNWHIDIVDTGKFFLPKPMFSFGSDDKPIPVVSMEKRRPLDPWKPNYIRATTFIKKYSPIHPLSKAMEYALWEVEECGEIAGSTAWENAEIVLEDLARESANVRAVLGDVFAKRQEEFALGSQVYLRILGHSGDEGFQQVCDFHGHPQRIKRCHVARALGELGRPEGIEVLLKLLDDEDPEVRENALRAIGRAGVPRNHAAAKRIGEYLESADISEQVLATVALMRGGDPKQEKRLIQFIKEQPVPLIDMGDLGRVIVDLKLYQCTPYLISRLKSDRVEVRDDAAEVVRELTGLNLEFHGHSSTEDRRNAVKQWTQWWEDYKKQRKIEKKAST
jgi:hypothetical protein